MYQDSITLGQVTNKLYIYFLGKWGDPGTTYERALKKAHEMLQDDFHPYWEYIS